MKVRILADADHRIRVGLTQAFKAGHEHDLPRATAEALIARGAAERIKPAARRGDFTTTAEQE